MNSKSVLFMVLLLLVIIAFVLGLVYVDASFRLGTSVMSVS